MNLTKSQIDKLAKIGAKFRKDMQKIVDGKNSGITGMSISSPSFNDGKEFVIVERKKPSNK